MMTKDYTALLIKVILKKKINYAYMCKVKRDWDKLTIKYMKGDKEELVNNLCESFTSLRDIYVFPSNSKEYFNKFIDYLGYSDDRMSFNRWLRLQLFLQNAINTAYAEEYIYEKKIEGE